MIKIGISIVLLEFDLRGGIDWVFDMISLLLADFTVECTSSCDFAFSASILIITNGLEFTTTVLQLFLTSLFRVKYVLIKKY